MTHEVFTIVAPIRDRAASTHLKQILAEINANPSGNARLPFVRLPMVHFASFVVFSDPVQDAAAPRVLDHLVFESCIDGPFDEYIKALLHLGLKTLHDLFSCCKGYDATVPSCDCVRDYIVAKRRKPHLLHIGSPGLRVDHIKAGDSLRRVLDRELDDVVKRGRSTDRPLDLMRALRAGLNCTAFNERSLVSPRADSHGNRTTALRMVRRSAISPHFAALALGKAHCACASAIGSPVVERLMALAARRGTFGGERGVCGGRRDLGLLVVADPRNAVGADEEAEG